MAKCLCFGNPSPHLPERDLSVADNPIRCVRQCQVGGHSRPQAPLTVLFNEFNSFLKAVEEEKEATMEIPVISTLS